MSFIDINSSKIYYQLIGEGTPIVFISGWTLSCDYWLPLVERLKKKYCCLLYDARGFGRSQPLSLESGVEIDDHSEDLHQLITSLKLKDVNLVGHGLGVWTAVLCARQHPQDVLTLTALAPESEASEKDSKSVELPSLWQQASILLKDLAKVPMVGNLVAWRYHNAPEPYRTNLYQDFAKADRRAAFHLLASCMGSDAKHRFQQALSELYIPTLLVRGTEDRICSVELLRSLFELIKAGKLATIRGCDHFPMLEYTDEFANLLLGFFEQNSGPKPIHALTRR